MKKTRMMDKAVRGHARRRMLRLVIGMILCLALLTGCGGAAASPTLAAQPSANMEPAGGSAQGTVWQARFVPLMSGSVPAELRSVSVSGETLYAISAGVIADETPEGVTPEWPEQYWVFGPVVVKTDLDGHAEALPYTPERPENVPGVNSGVLFEQLFAAPDGSVWIVENRYRIREEDSTTREEKTLVHLGEDGSVLKCLPLNEFSDFEDEARSSEGSYSFSVVGAASDGDGNLCLAVHEWFSGGRGYVQSNRILVLDETSGAVRYQIALDGEAYALVRLGDGRIAAASYLGASPVIALLDADEGSLTEVAALDGFLTGVAGGSGDRLYYGAGDSLFCLRVDTAEVEKLFDWSACDVAHSEESGVCVLSDGRVVTVTGKESASGVENELVLLSPVDIAQVPQRKTLRMAVTNLYPFTSEMVSRFNRSQSEYRIEVTDYSQYNDYTSPNEADWTAGFTRLQTELIAGKVPDLIDISLLPVSRLSELGLLEDLLPYIDADGELSREQLNGHVLDTFAVNGRLFQTVSNYYVMTTLGLSDTVGDRMGWTMADCAAALERLQNTDPESTVFDVYTSRDDAMTFLLYLEMEDYVDWSTGACRFDSESFRDLLRFVRAFPAAYQWNPTVTAAELDSDVRLVAGQQLMKQCNLSCFEDVQRNTVGLGGRSATFVGYPTESGVGSMFAQIGNSFAIASTCEEKEAAWAFVRQFFLPDYQEQFSGSVFPTNLSVYESMKREAMQTAYRRNPDGSFALDADGKRIEADRGSVMIAGQSVELRAATQAEVDLVEALTAATTHVLSTDESLKEILLSGAAAYFAGQRSIEDTVRQIQSRASIYVNEQR